jgi:hypothetical protein
MKQEKLLTEINRINELMGINILSEQGIPTLAPRLLRLIKNYGDEFFQFVERKMETQTIMNRVRGVANNLVENDIKVLLKNITSEGIQILAKQWFDNGLLFSRNVIDTAMQKRISKIVESKENYTKVCREILSGKDTFWGMFPPGQVPDYLVKFADEFADLFKKELDDILVKDYPKIWKWVKEKGFASKTLREIEEMSLEAVELLYKKLNPGLVDAFIQKLTGNFKQLTLKVDEIQQLIVKYQKTTDSSTRLQIEEIIDSSLVKLAQENEETFKYMSKWIDDNLKGDASLVSLKSKLKSTSNWKMAETLAKTTKTDKQFLALSEAWDTMKSHTNQFLRELRTFFYLKGWFKGGTKEFEQGLRQKYSRLYDSTDDIVSVLRNWFMTGSKRGLPFRSNPNYKKIYTVAGVPTAFLSYSSEVILNILKFHVYFMALETFSEWLVHSLRGFYEDETGWIPDHLKDFVKDYKATSKDSDSGDLILNVLKNMLRNFTDDFTKDFGGIVQIVPGYWDNLAKLIANIFYKGETEGFVKPEDVKKAVEVVKNEEEKIKDNVKNEIEKGKAERDSLEGQGPVKADSIVTSNPSSEENFKTFLKNKGTQMKDFYQSDSTGTDINGQNYYFDIDTKTFKPYN